MMVRIFPVKKIVQIICWMLLFIFIYEFHGVFHTLLQKDPARKAFLDNLLLGQYMNRQLLPVTRSVMAPKRTQNVSLLNQTVLPPLYVNVQDARIYLYSAVGVELSGISPVLGKDAETNTNQTKLPAKWQIVLNGWEVKTIKNDSFTCCFLLQNHTIVSFRTKKKRHWAYLGKAMLQAKQYVCQFNFSHHIIKGVNIVVQNNSTCDKNEDLYLKPTFPPKLNSIEIAVCTKLAYGSLDANRVVEWFEAHRLFGVTKVVAYLHDLNRKARQVFKYYQSLGLAELLEYSLPESDKIRRSVGKKNMQSWNDEQVVTFDCQERLYQYRYVAVMDTDEYMIPTKHAFNNSWHKYLDHAFRKKPFVGGMTFRSKVHVTSWGVSNKASRLFIGQFSNSTVDLFDRYKNIYMPSRVMPGSVATHKVWVKKGYRRYFVPAREAVMHHFRACRAEWLRKWSIEQKSPKLKKVYQFKTPQKCYDYIRNDNDATKKLAAEISNRVLAIRKELGIQLEQH